MTPNELSILKSLVVVAWADGRVEKPEAELIEALLAAFAASASERSQVLDFASQQRNLLTDLPLKDLSSEDREILLANAAVMAGADGHESPEEKELLANLVQVLCIPTDRVAKILASAKDGLLELGTDVLDDVLDELE
jgi:tellurite resistance protein